MTEPLGDSAAAAESKSNGDGSFVPARNDQTDGKLSVRTELRAAAYTTPATRRAGLLQAASGCVCLRCRNLIFDSLEGPTP